MAENEQPNSILPNLESFSCVGARQIKRIINRDALECSNSVY